MSRANQSHPRPPFHTKTPRQRARAVITLKGEIRRTQTTYGGLFTSHAPLNEPDRPEIYNSWFQFAFPGSDRRTLWNALIFTAADEFWRRVDEQVYDEVKARLTPEEHEAQTTLEFIPCEPILGRRQGYVIKPSPTVAYDSLGGLTYEAYKIRRREDIIRDNPPVIHERWVCDPGYAYGTGVSFIVDAPSIDQAVIERAIHQFKAMGETDWVNPVPVPRENLPQVTYQAALAALKERQGR